MQSFFYQLAALALLLPAATAPGAPESLCLPGQTQSGGAGKEALSAGDLFTVVSLNLAEETEIETIFNQLQVHPPLIEADFYLLQEVVEWNDQRLSVAEQLADSLGMEYLFAPSFVRGERWIGLAILSRFPLDDPFRLELKRYPLRFNERCRIALGATVRIGPERILLLNVHLDSRISSSERLEQLKPVLEVSRNFEGPVLLGGDFNTANFRWIRRLWPLPYLDNQREALRESLTEEGFETPFDSGPATFKFLWIPLRLDWIFIRGLTPQLWGVENVPFSDHRALWTSLTHFSHNFCYGIG